jgi:arginyl-tRNA synthetase
LPKFIAVETNTDIKLDVLNHKTEIDLIKEISKFNIVIEEAVYTLNPKVIAKYANKLSTKFNSFYESLPVLCDDSFLKVSRLLVVKVFVIVLTNLFDLLGIQTLSRI